MAAFFYFQENNLFMTFNALALTVLAICTPEATAQREPVRVGENKFRTDLPGFYGRAGKLFIVRLPAWQSLYGLS